MYQISLLLLNRIHLSIFSPIVLFIVHSLSCSSDELYLKVIKQCKMKASEESFSIRSDSTLYFTSPPYFNNELATHEMCIPSNASPLYLTMHDSNGDSWSSGSWIEVRKGNNEFVLNTVMTEMYDERVLISSRLGSTPNQCLDNQVYLKIIMSKNSYGNEESYRIMNGYSVLYSSSYMYSPITYTAETCLIATSNYQYTLVMSSSYGNGWYANDWIELYNIDNELVLRTRLDWGYEQQVNFNLYSTLPIQTICSDGKLFLMISKQMSSDASEESFQILSNNTVLYSSTSTDSSIKKNYYVCLPPSTNLQYSLTMLDTDGTWSSGSWI